VGVPLQCSVLSGGPDRTRTLRGAALGALAATVWALAQPLDKRLFRSEYDDVELLGRAVCSGDGWYPVGMALHVQNGALFGAVYANVAPGIPLPPALRGPVLGAAEHLATWPLVLLGVRLHPARAVLQPRACNWRAFAKALWEHALFGLLLGELDRRLSTLPEDSPHPLPADYSSNGHGRLQDTITVTSYDSAR